MKFKKLVFTVVLSAVIFGAYAKPAAKSDPYSGADKSTKKLLQKADDFIAQEKYDSAFKTLDSKENEYIIAKKTEICINYFVQSIGHRMFAFKDLENGETIMDLRKNGGEFTMFMYDPVEIIQSYTGKNGEKPILNLALGLYYDDILYRYPGVWFSSDKEVAENAIKYLQRALDQKFFTDKSLSELSFLYSKAGQFENSNKVLKFKKEQKIQFTKDDLYNYGVNSYYSGDYDIAIEYLTKSETEYKDNPEYLFDVYYMLSNCYIGKKDYKNAKTSLAECKKFFPQDNRITASLISLSAAQNDKSEAVKTAKELFATAPKNKAVTQTIIKTFENADVYSWLPDFFDSCIADYKKDSHALENLYYHYAITLETLGMHSKACDAATKAKTQFIKNGTFNEEVCKSMDAIINK